MRSPLFSASRSCSRPSACTNGSRPTKTRLIVFAIPALLLMHFALIGCALVSRDESASRQLYQPPVLRLSQAQPVPTQDGLYRPPTAEVWHSDARYRAMEAQVIDLTAALATERARR